MEGFCRGCLIKYYDPAELIQYTEKNRRLFVYCTGLQVKRNDMFTFQLCKDCFLNMKTSSRFKKICRTSDKRFKNYMALKNAGDTIDFPTFLKNNDDSLTFRLPLMNGSSTPENQKCRDDDNDSTCTSIRNFMTDILQGEEMPDTEARIIREVIEEEADVLDDSLDSHWLQDDISIDTDFKLDFGFSPFATPQSVNNDRYFTPRKLAAGKGNRSNTSSPNLKKKHKKHVYTNISGIIDSQSEQDYELLTNEQNDDKVKSKDKSDKNDLTPLVQNFYIPIEDLEPMNASFEINEKNTVNVNKDVIDKNLEEALKNEHNKKFSLEDILLTPPVFHGVSAASTPTINNILFGEKLVSPTKGKNHKYANVNGDIDILEKFLQNATEENVILDINNKNDLGNDKVDQVNDIQENYDSMSLVNMLDNVGDDFESHEDKFDLENNYCKLCGIHFKAAMGLQLHFQKLHKIEIRKKRVHEEHLCTICGKIFKNRFNYSRHLKIHRENKTPKGTEINKCDICSLECTSKSKLTIHVAKYHNKQYNIKDTGKLYVCNICGATCNSVGNYYVHMRRHEKLYSLECDHCGKGFYRKVDLVIHIRTHTGERPFACRLCPKQFARRDILAKHIRLHTTDLSFECQYCKRSVRTKRKLKFHMRKSKKCLKVQARLLEAAKIETETVTVAGDNDTITNQLLLIDNEMKFLADGSVECLYCKKSFVKKLNLRLHMRRSKKCQKMKAYLAKAAINNSETVTLDIKTVLFECKYCNKCFLKKEQLNLHMRKSKKCQKMKAQSVETAINDSETVTLELETGSNDTITNELPLIDTELADTESFGNKQKFELPMECQKLQVQLIEAAKNDTETVTLDYKTVHNDIITNQLPFDTEMSN